jgi:hypothetical protein
MKYSFFEWLKIAKEEGHFIKTQNALRRRNTVIKGGKLIKKIKKNMLEKV